MDLWSYARTGLRYLGLAILVIVGYELLRSAVVGFLAKRLRRRVLRYVREARVRVDLFKLTGKAYVKAEVLSDPVLAYAIADHAKEEKRPAEEIREEVESWLDEIIPSFN